MPPVLGSGRKAGWQRAEFDSIFIDGVQFTKDNCKHCGNEVSRKLERLFKYRSMLNNIDKNDTNNQNLQNLHRQQYNKVKHIKYH